MERRTVSGWEGAAVCPAEHDVAVLFTMSDYVDAPSLYQCAQCGDLIAIDRDAERYVGPPWDSKRETLLCPNCDESLAHAWQYPEQFRCPVCGSIGSFEHPPAYPEDDDRTTVSCWDPYADGG